MRITIHLSDGVLDAIRNHCHGDPRELSSLGAGLHILGLVIDLVKVGDRSALDAEQSRLETVGRHALDVLAVLAVERAETQDLADDAAFVAKATDAARMRERHRLDRVAFAAALDLCRSLGHDPGPFTRIRACQSCRDTVAAHLTTEGTRP